MRKLFYLSVAVIAMSLAAVGLAACGSAGGSTHASVTQASSTTSPTTVLAEVGGMSINRAMLSHWMATLIGGDYDENLGRPAPRGLVSEPLRTTRRA